MEPEPLRPKLAAHRGGAFLWPENSLPAIAGALRLPIEQVEIDIHAAADGDPIVVHDATLDRTTVARGPVRARSGAELRATRIKGAEGATLPGLDDVCRLLAPTTQDLRLELKCDVEGRPYPGLVARAVAVLDAFGLRGRTWLMSFEPLTLVEAAPLGGFAGLVLLLESRPWRGLGLPGAVALARHCGAHEIGLGLGEMAPGLPAALRAAGLGSSVWGANDSAGLRQALTLGLDAVTTDDPMLAAAMRAGS